MVSLAICVSSIAHADQFAKHNNTGNDLLKRGEADKALEEYQSARVERPNEPGVVYNIGTAYHQKGAFDSAVTELQNAIAHVDDPLKPRANYNLGNTLYRMNEYKAAIEAYKQTLLADPSDLDAKHNLEMALRQLNASDSSDKKQDDKQKQKDQDSSGQKQQQQPKSDSSGQQPPKDQQQPQNQPGDNQSDQPSDAENQQEPPHEQKPHPVQGMTRADAERLLDALKQNELALQKKRAQRTTGEKVAKDW